MTLVAIHIVPVSFMTFADQSNYKYRRYARLIEEVAWNIW